MPFASIAGPDIPGLVALFCGGVFTTELTTAYLLMTKAHTASSRAYLWLAAGCAFSAYMAVAHLLTFPGAILSSGTLIPAAPQSTAWIFHLWLWGHGLAVLIAVLLPVDRSAPQPALRHAAQWVFALPAALAALLCLAATQAADVFPALLQGERWTTINYVSAFGALAIVVGAIALIHWRAAAEDALYGWLSVSLVALIAANVVAALSGGRYTVGWIGGRFFWMASASLLLIYFVAQFRRQQLALAGERDELERAVAERTADVTRSHALLLAICEGTSDLIFAKDLENRIIFANPATARIIGITTPHLIGTTGIDGKIPRHELDALMANDRRIMDSGQAESVEEPITTEAGRRTFLSTKVPLRDASNRIVGLIGVSRDITDRKKAEEHTRLLLMEVSHRAKNLLAVVQAIVRQTSRGDEPRAFYDRLAARISGLSASHDLLVASQWTGVNIRALVTAQLSHCGGSAEGRIDFRGSDFHLNPGATQTLGIVLHELGTNATKYGALSNERGRVSLAWQLSEADGEQRFEMSWEEGGGPPVAPAARHGFGHTVLVRMVEHALGARVLLSYRAEGLLWSISAPAERILDQPQAAAPTESAPAA